MRIIGCDLHAAQQTIAMLDGDTGEVVERILTHDGEMVREFYASIPRPAVVGIEATGSMGWFLRLLEELAIPCRVGHPAAVRKAETRRQKHDRRDADLLLKLLVEDRFPAIWMPSTEQRDLRALHLHRHQWVRMRTRVLPVETTRLQWGERVKTTGQELTHGTACTTSRSMTKARAADASRPRPAATRLTPSTAPRPPADAGLGNQRGRRSCVRRSPSPILIVSASGPSRARNAGSNCWPGSRPSMVVKRYSPWGSPRIAYRPSAAGCTT